MTNSDPHTCPECGLKIAEDAPRGLCPQCVLAGAAATPTITTGRGRHSAPPTVGEIAPYFPDLEIVELLGAGGMGAVYKTRQPQLDRFVALKILSHDLSSDPAFAERFNREARVLAKLSHANIVAIFDYGTAGPHCFLLMELVDGVNLRQAMQAGRFTPAESLAMVSDICAALQFAHEEGILHRDIKPENVLIDSKGRVKIADFGIAKLVGDDQTPDVTLTMQGSVLGSPHYMAPEQIETPGDVDQRADIYSLGVVFYELLTGELPLGRFALPSEKTLMDARIDEIVLRTLEKERQARYQSADEMMTQVGAVAQNPGAAITSPPAAAASNSQNARFSLASAIFTGVSLILLVLSIILANADVMPRKFESLIALLVLGLSGCLGIVGIILGSVALREIRQSGGQKSGLGSAVFGVVSWLVIMMGLLSTLFLSMPRPADPETPRASIGILGVSFIMLVPQIIGAFVLVRGLRRWAGGVPTKDGGKRYPGLSRTFLAVIGLIILGPVTAEILTRFLPPSDSPLPDSVRESMREMRKDQERIRISIKESFDQQDIEWLDGSPTVSIPVEINPSLQVKFRLVIAGPNGPIDSAEIATLYSQGPFVESSEPVRTFLEVGPSGPENDKFAHERGFTCRIDHTGERETLYGNEDFSKWTFGTTDPLQVTEPGTCSIQLATRRTNPNNSDAHDKSLKLEVSATEE